MPSPPKPKVRSTAGKVQPAHRAAHEKGPDTEAPSPNRSQPVLAVVAFAVDDITALARFNFFNVHLCNVLERIAEVIGNGSEIPKHVAKLLGNLLAVAFIEAAAMVI